MTTRPQPLPPADRPGLSRSKRIGLVLAGLIGVALLAGACGSSAPTASTASTAAGGSSLSHTSMPSSGSGSGPVTRPGAKAGSGSGGNESTGGYSVAFAKCMRAHGLPKFPDSNGSAVPSGVDPTSAAYQAALNGPCKSLAPAGWVSSGPVTK